MSELGEVLRNFDYADHERGCEGRCYECTCGYDDRVRQRIFEAAARIEELEATLSDTVAYMKGDISGPAQKDGIIAEALRVLGKQ